jgi:hypothetical protein
VENTVSLLPHNAVHFVDVYQSGETPDPRDREFFWRGLDMAERIIGLLECVRNGEEVLVRLVCDPRDDYFCSGSSKSNSKCFGINNPW